jgi:DNA replication protein DnaC
MKLTPSLLSKHEELVLALRELKLPTIVQEFTVIAKEAEKHKLTYEQYLFKLLESELQVRRHNRVNKLLREAKLPLTKTLEQYDFALRTGITDKEFGRLCSGEFIKKCENVVFYGTFGVGKTHLAIILAQKACELGYHCYYTSTHNLINQLLTAKKNLEINSWMKRLDRFDLIVCDELGYTPHDQDGADLFFQLISQRAERKSILITTNLTYSEWDKVFLNPLATAAAVDRIIHKCNTYNIQGPSYRSMEAKNRSKGLTQEIEART